MDSNKCVHKYKKGKKEGMFCCKKITKNGNQKQFVCTKHNPDHIPNKRTIKNKQLNVITNKSNKFSSKNIYIDKIPSELGIKKNNQKIYKKNKNIKSKKIIIKGIINFKDILDKLLK